MVKAFNVFTCLALSFTASVFSPALSENMAEIIGYNNDGVKALNQGHFETAIKYFEKALRLDPKYQLATDNLAIARNNYGLELRNKPKLALSQFEKALYLDPSNTITLLNIQGLIRTMHLDPQAAEVRTELGRQALESGNIEGAIVEYAAAAQLLRDASTLGNFVELVTPIARANPWTKSSGGQRWTSEDLMTLMSRQIKAVWRPPAVVILPRVVVLFTLLKDGSVKDVRIKKGYDFNSQASQAALKAITDAAPFGPIPSTFESESNIEFTFTYNVVARNKKNIFDSTHSLESVGKFKEAELGLLSAIAESNKSKNTTSIRELNEELVLVRLYIAFASLKKAELGAAIADIFNRMERAYINESDYGGILLNLFSDTTLQQLPYSSVKPFLDKLKGFSIQSRYQIAQLFSKFKTDSGSSPVERLLIQHDLTNYQNKWKQVQLIEQASVAGSKALIAHNYANARLHYNDAYRDSDSVLGPHSLLTLRSLLDLAQLEGLEKNSKKSASLYRKVLDELSAQRNKDQLYEREQVLEMYGDMLNRTGQRYAAERIYTEVARLRKGATSVKR